MNESSPQCVGFIMDGNRRWAKTNGLPSLDGHTRGYDALEQMIRTVSGVQIPHMVVYAFSTENWKRAEDEVGHLMNLFSQALTELTETLIIEGKKINVRVIGQRERLPKKLQEEIAVTEAKNTANPELTLWIAVSYGARAEIVDAVNHAVAEGTKVDETTFGNYLWTGGMPDPDLIIRTSGEIRLSNFLLWQSAYSEFFFTDTLWPDFGETEFKSILEEYGKRQRRRGT
jgi:undecaprenyl diphosphate synthase